MASSKTPSIAHLVTPTSKGGQQQTQASRLLTPTTTPIPLLPATSAKKLVHVYTALIPLYYYLRSSALVRDPLSMLSYDLIPIAIATALFCAACLPSAGNWNSGTKDGGKIIEGTAAIKTGKGSVRKKGTKVTSVGDRDGVGGRMQSRVMVRHISYDRTRTD